jgi:hypothetical protein
MIKLGMQALHVISEELTKWNLQTILILLVIPLHSYAML